MRRYSLSLLATAAVISFSASVASAADLPRKAPAYVPPAPPPFSWTGFYIGGHGGAGWGTVETSLGNLCDTFGNCFNTGGNAFSQTQLNGWLAGGTVGYNWQVNPWLVLGLEGDFTWTDIKGTSPCTFEGPIPVTLNASCGSRVKWTADVTGRVGFAVDRALLYVKGGAVWAKSDHTFFSNVPAGPPGFFFTTTAAESDTRLGGLLGAGIEYAFLPNWSAKIEYNYMDFGHSDRAFPGSGCNPFAGGCTPFTADINLREVLHTVKVGVNYRFDWGRN